VQNLQRQICFIFKKLHLSIMATLSRKWARIYALARALVMLAKNLGIFPNVQLAS
jgi:hypothetical protein